MPENRNPLKMVVPHPQSSNKPSIQFWLLSAFLLFLFLTGGSSRLDVQSLIILTPVSIIACGLAMLTLRPVHLRNNAALLAAFASVILLTALHLVPLPAGLLINGKAGADLLPAPALTGAGDSWRSFTPTPGNGTQALLAFAIPGAVLLFGVQLNRDDLFRTLPMVVGLGLTSGLLGLLQLIGGTDGVLYFYRITNAGGAVGLFANRNHAAVFLAILFPMIAVLAVTYRAKSKRNDGRLLAVACAAVLIPLILVTGSRSGLLLAVVGMLGGLLIYQSADKTKAAGKSRFAISRRTGVLVGGIIVACLAFTTMYFSRAVAINRLFASGPEATSRSDFWAVSLDLFWRYFPFGSGSGSFADVYQLHEPRALLDSTYLNRAHNDWLEVAVTMGLPSLLVAAVLLFFYVRRTFSIWMMDGSRRSVVFSRLASLNLVMLAVASISDYPLRTPVFMGLMAVLLLWLAEARGDEGRSHRLLPRTAER